jgi:hypothetical protein
MYGRHPDDFREYSILGSNVQTILDGFGTFTLLASKILLDLGLGTEDSQGIGLVKLIPTQWYPLPAWIRAWERIQAEFGDYTVKQAGLCIPKRATRATDSQMSDIETAFKQLDAAYHLNHAKNGVAMYNPKTGQKVEGIGHYHARAGTSREQIIVDVDSVSPCAFSTGIVEGITQLFDVNAKVTHDPKTCRKNGARACTFNITYRYNLHRSSSPMTPPPISSFKK